MARDAELNREVALKQILEHHADDPASRARFVLEAEVTGGLEHPGIVPVYGLGTYADGRPYYAMRFIRGDSLDRVIRQFHSDQSLKSQPGRRSLELRKLLRRFVDACNAIDYAHSRGVLHRDIKPGNIIVGNHGETLVVDWGLAKAKGMSEATDVSEERPLTPSSASRSAETLPGSALGTPAYMSPEQACGELANLGPRSDVYGLGTTLYCLLTGQAPQHGDDLAEVLSRVQRGEFVPPRKIDPSIDRSLEAVCVKAMAFRTEDRYASGRALAEDIERWMADEPVTARLDPWTRKLVRWLTRHRTGVTGLAAAGLAAFVGLVAVAVVQTRANAELTRSKAAVQARYDLAIDAIRTFHTGVSEDFLLTQEQFKDLRDRLLMSAADFYGKLGALLGKESDPASQRAMASSNFELAELTVRVGRSQDALAMHRAVLAAREAMAAMPRADDQAKVDVGLSLTAVASLLESTGHSDKALEAFGRAETLLAGQAGHPAARAALADCRSRIGKLFASQGKYSAALGWYQLARADQEALASAPGASSQIRRDLADTINRMGGVHFEKLANSTEAEADWREALELRRQLALDYPGVTEFRSRVADSHNNLGLLLGQTGRMAEAEAELRVALELRMKLVGEYPAVAEFRSRVGSSHHNLAFLLDQKGKAFEAEAEYRAAITHFQKLSDEYPAVTEFRRNLVDVNHNLGWLLSQIGKLAEAEAVDGMALAICQELAAQKPDATIYRKQQANLENNLSVALRRLGRGGEARAHCDRAIALSSTVTKESRAEPSSDVPAEYFMNRGLARSALGDLPGAAADLQEALRVYDAQSSRKGEEWFMSACCHAALADLAGRSRPHASRAAVLEQSGSAMAALQKAVELGYRKVYAYQSEDALDSLRSRNDFQLMMMDLSFPSEPFTRAN